MTHTPDAASGTDPIEAAARACYDVTNDALRGGFWEGWQPQAWEDLQEHERDLHRNYARAGMAFLVPPPPGDAERLDLVEKVARIIDPIAFQLIDSSAAARIGGWAEPNASDAKFKARKIVSLLVPASRPDGTGGRDQMGATPMGSGYSGFAPSPMVSASGEYPSRSQSAMVRRLTEEYFRVNWPSMSVAGQHYARNRMTDALRKSGFGLVALGTEAGTAKTEGLGPKDDGPADLSATPQTDPVGEAKALLAGLDPRWTYQEHIRRLRRGALCNRGNPQADAIEAALATLRSSQAGEVRDDG